jgi:hypothetical protein
MAKPIYGVDGNLLVEDLPYSHDDVEAILNGTFKATFWAHQFSPLALVTNYPQLRDERLGLYADAEPLYKRSASGDLSAYGLDHHATTRLENHPDVLQNSGHCNEPW